MDGYSCCRKFSAYVFMFIEAMADAAVEQGNAACAGLKLLHRQRGSAKMVLRLENIRVS